MADKGEAAEQALIPALQDGPYGTTPPPRPATKVQFAKLTAAPKRKYT